MFSKTRGYGSLAVKYAIGFGYSFSDQSTVLDLCLYRFQEIDFKCDNPSAQLGFIWENHLESGGAIERSSWLAFVPATEPVPDACPWSFWHWNRVSEAHTDQRYRCLVPLCILCSTHKRVIESSHRCCRRAWRHLKICSYLWKHFQVLVFQKRHEFPAAILAA